MMNQIVIHRPMKATHTFVGMQASSLNWLAATFKALALAQQLLTDLLTPEQAQILVLPRQ